MSAKKTLVGMVEGVEPRPQYVMQDIELRRPDLCESASGHHLLLPEREEVRHQVKKLSSEEGHKKIVF